MPAEAISNALWYEIQGCANSDGTWHAVFHLSSKAELDQAYQYVIDHCNEAWLGHWNDFRRAYPTAVAEAGPVTVWQPRRTRRRHAG